MSSTITHTGSMSELKKFLIQSIKINKANVKYVGSAGEVSGLLYTEIDRVMEAYLRAGSSDTVKLDESSVNADIWLVQAV